MSTTTGQALSAWQAINIPCSSGSQGRTNQATTGVIPFHVHCVGFVTFSLLYVHKHTHTLYICMCTPPLYICVYAHMYVYTYVSCIHPDSISPPSPPPPPPTPPHTQTPLPHTGTFTCPDAEDATQLFQELRASVGQPGITWSTTLETQLIQVYISSYIIHDTMYIRLHISPHIYILHITLQIIVHISHYIYHAHSM